MAAWVIRAGKKGGQEESALKDNLVTIHWKELPDLSEVRDKKSLEAIYRATYPEETSKQVAIGVGQVWRFCRVIEPGHLVALPRLLKSNRMEVAIGRISGPYEYRADLGEHIRHVRSVQWICRDIRRGSFKQDLQKSLGLPPTVYQIGCQDAEQRLLAVLSGHVEAAGANAHRSESISTPLDRLSDRPVPVRSPITTSLARTLDEIRETIAQLHGAAMNEQNTKAALINTILSALGWHVGNPAQVHMEFEDADYALFIERDGSKPIILVEAKSLQEDLNQTKHARQIMGYTGTLGPEWAVLTNGDEWQVYSVCRGGRSLEENRFFVVRVTDPNTEPEKHLSLLSRENVINGGLQDAWEDELADRIVHEAAARLFSGVPDPRLVNLVRKVLGESTSLVPAERIRDSLSRFHKRFSSRGSP
jgi:hypothetical protein